MLNFNSILIGSESPKSLGEFYKKVLQRDPEWGEDEWVGFQVGAGFLTIGPHSEVKGKNKEPGRIMFNLETEDVQAEFTRIKNLAAHVVAEPYQPEQEHGMWIATFADPDGNYFQLMSPMTDLKKN